MTNLNGRTHREARAYSEFAARCKHRAGVARGCAKEIQMPLTPLPITLVLAGGLALINLWLSIRVGQVRRAEKVFVGDGGSEALIRRMRAQAKFVENAPFVLALVAAIEFSTGTSTWLWIAAVAFLAARVAHAIGMDGRLGQARLIGTVVTMLLLLGLGVWAIALPFVARADSRPAIVDMAVPNG